MFINITLSTGSASADIRIDSGQRILSGINTVSRSGRLAVTGEPRRCFSMVNEKMASTYRTFAQERIYDGDCLTIME